MASPKLPSDPSIARTEEITEKTNIKHMKNNQAVALHDLICKMLRGVHIRSISGADLPAYIFKAGVALHNLPLSFANNEPLTVYQLSEINGLDPLVTGSEWGGWVVALCEQIGQAVPPKALP